MPFKVVIWWIPKKDKRQLLPRFDSTDCKNSWTVDSVQDLLEIWRREYNSEPDILDQEEIEDLQDGEWCLLEKYTETGCLLAHITKEEPFWPPHQITKLEVLVISILLPLIILFLLPLLI